MYQVIIDPIDGTEDVIYMTDDLRKAQEIARLAGPLNRAYVWCQATQTQH